MGLPKKQHFKLSLLNKTTLSRCQAIARWRFNIQRKH